MPCFKRGFEDQDSGNAAALREAVIETRWSQNVFLNRSHPPPGPLASPSPPPAARAPPLPTHSPHTFQSGTRNYIATHTGVEIKWDDANACHF